MAYSMDEILKDPDFQQSDPDTQRAILQKRDKTFSQSDRATQDKLLTGFNKKQTQMDRQAPKIAGDVGRRMFDAASRGLTTAVGGALETATQPLVPIARLAQGEPLSQVASSTGRSMLPPGIPGSTFQEPSQPGKGAMEAAKVVVPQAPWQVGALAAGGLAGKAAPVVGKLATSGLGRILASGLGGAAAEQATGGEPMGGAAAGMGQQIVGEALPSLTGVMRRHLGRSSTNVANREAGNVAQALSEASPTFKGAVQPQGALSKMVGGGAPGQSQRLGQFALHEAPEAASAEFGQALDLVDSALSQGGVRINTPELQRAARLAVKGLDPVINAKEIADLAPAHGGWDAGQVANIIRMFREAKVGRAIGDPTFAKQQAMAGIENIMQSIEQQLHLEAMAGRIDPKIIGVYRAARSKYALDSGLSEMLSGGFPTGGAGYHINMQALQKAASDPELARRLSPGQLSALRQVLSRGASTQPGFSDVGARGVPLIPASPTGLKFGLLRQLLTGGRTVIGNKPFTPGKNVRVGTGFATGQAAKKAQEE